MASLSMEEVVTGLESNQIKKYLEDGFLFPLKAMDAACTQGYRDRLEALEARYAAKGPDRDLNQYFRVNAHLVLPMAMELAKNPVILEAISSIIGPNILVWSVEFFIKEANTDKIVSWHQDMTYWGLGEGVSGDTEHLASAWLALSPATLDSGCMKFVAGSHKKSIQPHKDTFSDDNLLSRGQEMEVDVAPDEEVAIELTPGEFSIHHGRMFHYSGPNVSDDRRIGVVVRYVTPEIKQLVGKRDYAVLVRGIDAKQNWISVAPPSADFEPESMAIYEQVLADQSEALTQGADNVALYQNISDEGQAKSVQ
ncbi:MAG: phytanoyl-CoA dioxygenase family protein [Rhizobiaceae bacterium]